MWICQAHGLWKTDSTDKVLEPALGGQAAELQMESVLRSWMCDTLDGLIVGSFHCLRIRYSDRGAISKPNVSHLTDRRNQAKPAIEGGICVKKVPRFLFDCFGFKWTVIECQAPHQGHGLNPSPQHRRLQVRVTRSPPK